MPAKSAKQLRLMQAAAGGNVAGIAPSVGKEFVKETPDKKKKAFANAFLKKKGMNNGRS